MARTSFSAILFSCSVLLCAPLFHTTKAAGQTIPQNNCLETDLGEYTECVGIQLLSSEEELKYTNQKVTAALRHEPLVYKKFLASQNSWIRFRNTQCELEAAQEHSMETLEVACLLDMNIERAKSMTGLLSISRHAPN